MAVLHHILWLSSHSHCYTRRQTEVTAELLFQPRQIVLGDLDYQTEYISEIMKVLVFFLTQQQNDLSSKSYE